MKTHNTLNRLSNVEVQDLLNDLGFNVSPFGAGKLRIKGVCRPQAIDVYAYLAAMTAVERIEVKNNDLRIALGLKDAGSWKGNSDAVSKLLQELENAGLITRITLSGTHFPNKDTNDGEAKRFIQVNGVDVNIPEAASDLIGEGAVPSEIIEAFEELADEAIVVEAA